MGEEIEAFRFVQQEQRLLNKFHDYWCTKRNENPNEFPEKMLVGDWQEQFEIWLACQAENIDG